MTMYLNVTVSPIATGSTADVDEAAQVWGGTWSAPPTAGQHYLLTNNDGLDWPSEFSGQGSGTQASPYLFTPSDA